MMTQLCFCEGPRAAARSLDASIGSGDARGGDAYDVSTR